jgi:hypothetical protein
MQNCFEMVLTFLFARDEVKNSRKAKRDCFVGKNDKNIMTKSKFCSQPGT